MAYISNKPILKNPDGWVGIWSQKPSVRPGHVNLMNYDGNVINSQPDGTLGTSAPGTDGDYEQFVIMDNSIVSDYRGPFNPEIYYYAR